ncbi:MAG: tetratricopeptide repeat protein [Planctomycetaceae bacterium]|nr:tetratricopeptide repeat protein [Planctomycetaceae bacterium]
MPLFGRLHYDAAVKSQAPVHNNHLSGFHHIISHRRFILTVGVSPTPKEISMRCKWLHRLVGVTTCSGALLLSGCYSMNGYVMNASGQAYYSQGNYALAAQEFQTALQNSPGNPDYMANLAKARSRMGDQQTAEQLYRTALAADPAHQPSYHGLAELLVQQNRSGEAVRMLNTWAATQPYVAESHVELAWLQREMGQPDAAAQSLQQALQVNPNHATALAHLGQYYQDQGQQTQALSMYQQSLAADWNQPEVHSRLATVADAVGANHPMSETAMARGVHPHSLPRQQLAAAPGFLPGPMAGPMPGPQFAQFAPMQAPMYSSMAAPGPIGIPQSAGQFQSPQYYSPQSGAFAAMPPVGLPNGNGFAPMQNHAAAMPPNGAGFPGSAGMQGAGPGMMPFSFSGGTITSVENPTSTAAGAVAPVVPQTPIPDPAFSGSSTNSVPVTSVSQTTVTHSEAPEEVEAF